MVWNLRLLNGLLAIGQLQKGLNTLEMIDWLKYTKPRSQWKNALQKGKPATYVNYIIRRVKAHTMEWKIVKDILEMGSEVEVVFSLVAESVSDACDVWT